MKNSLPLHDWNLTPKEAVALQKEWAGRIDGQTPLPRFDLVAGADISYNRFSPDLFAAVVVYRVSDGAVIEKAEMQGKATFPYVPGLLTFREAPMVLDAFAKLKHRPDVVMVDGQGIAHPRRIGIASHLGLWLDLPTIGCAKSRLLGTFDGLAKEAGSTAPLIDKDEIIGNVVRTKNNCNPLYISVGHKIDLESAIRVVLACCRGYRIPEPTRQAHLHVNEMRRRPGNDQA